LLDTECMLLGVFPNVTVRASLRDTVILREVITVDSQGPIL
jgi:hypothetical protein